MRDGSKEFKICFFISSGVQAHLHVHPARSLCRLLYQNRPVQGEGKSCVTTDIDVTFRARSFGPIPE